MSKTGNMNSTPSEVGNQAGNNTCPKQTTLEQPAEIGAACISSEASEFNPLLGPEAMQNEHLEERPSTSTVWNGKSQFLSDNLLDNSITDPSPLPPEDVNKCCQTYDISCSQQSISEQKLECGVALGCSERSDRQVGSIILLNEIGENSKVSESSVDKADRGENIFTGHKEPLKEDIDNNCQTGAEQTLQPGLKDQLNELDAEFIHCGLVEQMHQLGSQFKKSDTSSMVLQNSVNGNLQSLSEGVTNGSLTEAMNSPAETGESLRSEGLATVQMLEINLGTINESSPREHTKQPPEGSVRTAGAGPLGQSSAAMVEGSGVEQGVAPMHVESNFRWSESEVPKTPKSLKKRYISKSLINTDRVLRSRSQEKPKAPEQSNIVVHATSDGEKRRKQKKKKGKQIVVDEYSRIRSHLRYLLNRINYEQSLIAAYSSEGWKGLSLEKLKPEKELQRATSEILRRKLKLRDLFQRLDSLCSEGRLPSSLFDTEGQIDSEDIFCAKCGSKDLSVNNDIILCDGACDRGFHQRCLEPPMLNEDIPPDDEGWLCPACDCKVDCIELVNESQGINLSITDSWEKVFPEAAASGDNKDPNFGLPSDESDDNDYDPEGVSSDENDQGDESSSDESNFTSASEELETSTNDKQYLGLPSDDSEDDDYDPDAPELDEKTAEKNSSSDFTSDSEDLDAVCEDNMPSGNGEGVTYGSPLGDSNGLMSKTKDSLDNELSVSESGQGAVGPIYKRRNIERLDYKKLYDETYGNDTSDSSDDDDFTDDISPRERRKRTRESSPESPDRNSAVVRNRKRNKEVESNKIENEYSQMRKTRRKLNSEGTSASPAKSHEGIAAPSSSGKKSGSSYSRLGEAVTQGLQKSFKVNQYPDRTTKETLAQELGITFRQVSKWFENARWFFNHPSARVIRTSKNAPEKVASSPHSGTQVLKPSVDVTESSSGNVKNSQPATPKSNRHRLAVPKSRRRKSESKPPPQTAYPKPTVEAMQNPSADPPEEQKTKKGGRVLRSRRNSVG